MIAVTTGLGAPPHDKRGEPVVGRWMQPYPEDVHEYWEYLEHPSSVAVVTAVAIVQPDAPSGSLFATLVTLGPVYNSDGNRLIASGLPAYSYGTIMEAVFVGMDNSGISVQRRESTSFPLTDPAPWMRLDACLSKARADVWFAPLVRWIPFRSCRDLFAWKEPVPLRFPLITHFEMKPEFTSGLAFQLRAADNRLHATVVR